MEPAVRSVNSPDVARALHITNGDSAAGVIRAAGIAEPILPWRDVLHDGPVPGGLSLEALSDVRAEFIAGAGWADPEAVRAEFAERDRTLTGCAMYAEVVLWFEHDLYDQLQLIQILDWFAARPSDVPQLWLVCEAEYLGTAAPGRLRELHAGRVPVTTDMFTTARCAWSAFTSSTPSAIEQLLKQDTGALRFLAAAMKRLLEEFPSTRDGLSRSERQALEAIAAGSTTLGRAYVAAHHEREGAVFLGDRSFACYLERMSRCRVPFLTHPSGEPVTAPRRGDDARAFWESQAVLTDSGVAVLAGQSDHVALNGIDRWIGSTHLTSERHWRWDQRLQTLLARSTSG